MSMTMPDCSRTFKRNWRIDSNVAARSPASELHGRTTGNPGRHPELAVTTSVRLPCAGSGGCCRVDRSSAAPYPRSNRFANRFDTERKHPHRDIPSTDGELLTAARYVPAEARVVQAPTSPTEEGNTMRPTVTRHHLASPAAKAVQAKQVAARAEL